MRQLTFLMLAFVTCLLLEACGRLDGVINDQELRAAQNGINSCAAEYEAATGAGMPVVVDTVYVQLYTIPEIMVAFNRGADGTFGPRSDDYLSLFACILRPRIATDDFDLVYLARGLEPLVVGSESEFRDVYSKMQNEEVNGSAIVMLFKRRGEEFFFSDGKQYTAPNL